MVWYKDDENNFHTLQDFKVNLKPSTALGIHRNNFHVKISLECMQKEYQWKHQQQISKLSDNVKKVSKTLPSKNNHYCYYPYCKKFSAKNIVKKLVI